MASLATISRAAPRTLLPFFLPVFSHFYPIWQSGLSQIHERRSRGLATAGDRYARAVPYRAVSFDLFDTLVDITGTGDFRSSTGDLHTALRDYTDISHDEFVQVLRRVDREIHRPRFEQGIEVSSETRFGDVIEHLGVSASGLAKRLAEIHMGVLQAQVRTPSHHVEVLRGLRHRARVGLCSNFTHAPTALSVLEESHLHAQLDAIVISVDVGIRKPRPEIFQAILEALGTAPEETLHVGDNLRADVGGAAAVGMKTVWITRRIGDVEAELAHYDGPPPDYTVADLREIGPLLEPRS